MDSAIVMRTQYGRRWCLGLLVFFAFINWAQAGFEDRRHEKTRLKLVESINSLLIQSGICSSIAECQKSKILFVSPKGGGVAVQIWGVNKAAAFLDISRICETIFFENTELQEISIDIYFVRKEDALNLPIWKPAKTNVEILFKRNQ